MAGFWEKLHVGDSSTKQTLMIPSYGIRNNLLFPVRTLQNIFHNIFGFSNLLFPQLREPISLGSHDFV